MGLFSAEKKLKVDEIADLVRESSVTVLRWLQRDMAEGIQGLRDALRAGCNSIITDGFRKRLLEMVRRRPRSLELEYACGPCNVWLILWRKTLVYASQRKRSGEPLPKKISCLVVHSTRFRARTRNIRSKKTIEEARDQLKPDDLFYYADEFNVSWLPTLRAMWSLKGQQVMIPTPGQPKVHDGLGAVNYHIGEPVVMIRPRKRRLEVAELLQALVDKHSTGTLYVAWDNARTHQDDEVEAVVCATAGRLVLLYLPTYSPWLNPIEM